MAIMTKANLYRRIDSMRKKYNLTTPFDPYELARLFSIKIRVAWLDCPHIMGVLVRGDRLTPSIITLNSRLSETSRRFTLTHELVHFELHGEAIHFKCDIRDGSPIEWQANEGAAELLVPYRLFLQSLPGTRSFLRRKVPSLLESMPETYMVSRMVIEGRFRALAYEIEQKMQRIPIDTIEVLSRTQQQARGITSPILVPSPWRLGSPDIVVSDEEWARFWESKV